jgi:anti-anti-sigma factor
VANFTFSRNTDGATVVLRPSGYLDNLAAEQIVDAGNEALRRGCRSIELDCAKVQFINSVGISVLASLIHQAREAGCALSFSRVSKVHQEVFTIMGIAKFVQILPAERTASDEADVRR